MKNCFEDAIKIKICPECHLTTLEPHPDSTYEDLLKCTFCGYTLDVETLEKIREEL